MSHHTTHNHFQLFDLPVQFDLDLDQLNQRYRKVQSEVHPDRFAAASAAERLKSMQLATLTNEAYQTLKQPTARARYLLQLQGIDTQEESNTAMPTDFLMLQMEWREALEEAVDNSDIAALDKLLLEMRKTARQLEQTLQQQLDHERALQQAAGTVRKLSFIDKAQADVEQAIARLEDA
ncbi:MAG: Fe-S protein assembly co-chaperone HscB [Methylophilaceae bacterium]|jgi:molecular chaperone HscB|nr:Fe-S protein assembly co-chaperone HscB [Methylophilaceae bacterium]